MYDCLPSINLTPQCSSRTRNFGVSTCFKLPQYVNCGILDSKWSSICAINSNRFGDDRPYFSDEHGNEALDFGLFERDKDREIRLTGDHKGKQDEAEMVEQPAKSGVNESDLSIGDIFKFRGQKKDEIAKPQKLDSEFEESDEPKMRRQMLRRSNIMAKQVISIRSAFALGFVSQLWVDPNSWVVMVVEVKPNLLSGDSDRFLLKEIRQVGDVILVHDENVISDDLKLVGLETLVGYTVVTPRRHNVGKVRGYTFNINSGTVESLELDSFGISIIPSSLVSTYALFVDDVLEVFPDTVVVRDAAVSRIQRLTKGFWNGPNASKSNDIEERLNADGGYTGKRRRSRKSSTKKRKSEDDWQLPMDYL